MPLDELRLVGAVIPNAESDGGRDMRECDYILVVEDDDSVRDILKLALEDEGYQVITAANGAEALTVAAARPPRLIVLDLRMPVLSGWDFSRMYQSSSGKAAPILVLSAGTERELDQAKLPGAAFLAKPFELDELLAAVRELTAGSPPSGVS
jgi:DNA-binding response OmpR family regulator